MSAQRLCDGHKLADYLTEDALRDVYGTQQARAALRSRKRNSAFPITPGVAVR